MSFPSTGSPTVSRNNYERRSFSNDCTANVHNMPFGHEAVVSRLAPAPSLLRPMLMPSYQCRVKDRTRLPLVPRILWFLLDLETFNRRLVKTTVFRRTRLDSPEFKRTASHNPRSRNWNTLTSLLLHVPLRWKRF